VDNTYKSQIDEITKRGMSEADTNAEVARVTAQRDSQYRQLMVETEVAETLIRFENDQASAQILRERETRQAIEKAQGTKLTPEQEAAVTRARADYETQRKQVADEYRKKLEAAYAEADPQTAVKKATEQAELAQARIQRDLGQDLDAVYSGAGVESVYKMLTGEHLTGKEISQKYQNGDELARKLYENSALLLAHGIVGVANLNNLMQTPDDTVIAYHGGGFRVAGLMDRVTQIIAKQKGTQPTLFTDDISINACAEGVAIAAFYEK
jgi:hypothetical protein